MSNARRMIELKAPTFQKKDNKCNETLVSVGHKCEYCQGNGYFWTEDGTGDYKKKPCPVCGGKGMLDAVITIKWQPTSME